jgi:3',5'-cyclic AMP phosphodiesterase CpdA
VSPARLVIVSDTHLADRAPEAETNWATVLAHVDRFRPDLVIHLGDLTLDGMSVPDDLPHGRAQLDALASPWRAVPGNHDIGDNPSPVTPAPVLIDAWRRQRWLDDVGEDRWSASLAGWRLIALNAQLFGSGLPAEEEQWDWLGAQCGPAQSGQPMVLITHKPIDAGSEELIAAPPYRFVPAPARRRLAGLFDGDRPRLVLSGHVHQYRRLEIGGVTHAWAPTTWAVVPDDAQATLGVKRCGVLLVELDGDTSTVELAEPDGMRQLTMGRDFPDPYSH